MPITAQSDSKGSSAKELKLQLVGTAKTSVSYRDYVVSSELPTPTHEETNDEFLTYEVQLACFDGKATAGTHSFPFSIMLPPGLYSSMKVRRDRSVGMLERCTLACMTYLFSAGLRVYTVCSTCVHAENELDFPRLLLKLDNFRLFC